MMATVWEFLAVSLRYPDMAFAQAVASGEWPMAAAEIAGALGAQIDALPDDPTGCDNAGNAEAVLANSQMPLLRATAQILAAAAR